MTFWGEERRDMATRRQEDTEKQQRGSLRTNGQLDFTAHPVPFRDDRKTSGKKEEVKSSAEKPQSSKDNRRKER